MTRIDAIPSGAPLPDDATLDAERFARHAPDEHLIARNDDDVIASASIWWRETPTLNDRPTGVIGHFHAPDDENAEPLVAALLDHAVERLAVHGCRSVVGPMDGNTWRSYRFVVHQGSEPPFLLEPWQPATWPAFWRRAGFAPCASYTSALVSELPAQDERLARLRRRLERSNVTIRSLRLDAYEEELGHLFDLCCRSFAENFLYTPIGRAEFIAQYTAVQTHVDPELVLLAEQDGVIAGFVFAIPDLAGAQRGGPPTAIVKSLAVDPSWFGRGLGGILLREAHLRARARGYERAIHALMHESNRSQSLSAAHAVEMRRYALFAREVTA